MKFSKSYTVEKYLELEAAQDRSAIAEFFVERFEERYLVPVTGDSNIKNGFTMMAISCLTIESLESFARGWASSQGKSELPFCSFFTKWEEFSYFRPVSQEFYKHIRCGILHQAETTGGWRIIRSGSLLDGKTINATKFVGNLRRVLGRYSSSLRNESWDSELWQAFRKKMAALCRNARH